MNLLLLQYNNYYNRIVKRSDSIADYDDYIIAEFNKINFNPGDGVDTQQILNYDGKTQPDYVLIVDDAYNIVSRWFVVDADFIRKGQYNITLHRDLIADAYDQVIESPCFIEKATVSDDDPAIYNEEKMTVNQIKTRETLLTDESGIPWIVGYVPTDSFKTDTTVDCKFADFAGTPDITVDGIENWKYYQYTNLGDNHAYIGNCKPQIIYQWAHEFYSTVTNPGYTPGVKNTLLAQIGIDANGKLVDTDLAGATYNFGKNSMFMKLKENAQLDTMWKNGLLGPNTGFGSWAGVFYTSLASQTVWGDGYLPKVQQHFVEHSTSYQGLIEQSFGVHINDDPYSASIESLNGLIIQDKKTGISYEMIVTKTEDDTLSFQGGDNFPFDYFFASDFPTDLQFEITTAGQKYAFYTNDPHGHFPVENVSLKLKGTSYRIQLRQKRYTATTTITNQDGRTHLQDAPYDMFCIPCPVNKEFNIKNGDLEVSCNYLAGLSMAAAIGAQTGEGNVYDIQLMPYFPMREAIINGQVDISSLLSNAIVAKDDPSHIYSYVIWCDKSNFEFDINQPILVKNKKESNELDVYRLCSPNYASVFEFSPAQNDGVTKFNVDCTYKPFNSYVHVNPNFKGLYGKDFNDSRGLILSGDFSLTQLNSAWANYELTNKNFETSFQREVTNLKTQNKYQRISEIANAATGAFTGLGAGNMMFGMGKGMFSPAGLIGGAATGIASGLAGAADIKINDALRAENLSFMQDMHDFQLGNIQAIPYTIGKSSALTANNKLFPFIEFYTCTETERQAFRNKIKYTGMTINRIGTIKEFMKPEQTFIKGQLIRADEIKDDFHFINSLAAEINKGIYI